jgi:hypothetical protein
VRDLSRADCSSRQTAAGFTSRLRSLLRLWLANFGRDGSSGIVATFSLVRGKNQRSAGEDCQFGLSSWIELCWVGSSGYLIIKLGSATGLVNHRHDAVVDDSRCGPSGPMPRSASLLIMILPRPFHTDLHSRTWMVFQRATSIQFLLDNASSILYISTSHC